MLCWAAFACPWRQVCGQGGRALNAVATDCSRGAPVGF